MDKNILSLNSQYDEFTLKLDKAKRLLNAEKIAEAKAILLGIISKSLYHIEAQEYMSLKKTMIWLRKLLSVCYIRLTH